MNAFEFNAIGAEQWARTHDRTHANAYYFQQQTKKAHPKVRVRHEVQQTRPVLLGQQVPQPRKNGVSHKVRELKVEHKLLCRRQERNERWNICAAEIGFLSVRRHPRSQSESYLHGGGQIIPLTTAESSHRIARGLRVLLGKEGALHLRARKR